MFAASEVIGAAYALALGKSAEPSLRCKRVVRRLHPKNASSPSRSSGRRPPPAATSIQRDSGRGDRSSILRSGCQLCLRRCERLLALSANGQTTALRVIV